MKKELSPGMMWGLIALAAIVVIGFGFVFVNQQTSTVEDPELARKQWEVERSRTPRGEGAATNVPPPPSGYSPGRESELEARQRTSNP